MKNKYYFYDTSALLAEGKELDFTNVLVSSIVLSELENIKTSATKDEATKAKARLVARRIVDEYCQVALPGNSAVDRVYESYKDHLQDKNDSKILCQAKVIADEGHDVTFVTADICQSLLANLLFREFYNVKLINEYSDVRLNDGFKRIVPTDEQYNVLYDTSKNENVFDLVTNEYVIMEDEEGNVLGYARWDGEEYVQLGYKDIRSTLFGNISPRNTEQKVYMDLLQNENIPIVSCISRRGTGRMFALSYGDI